MTGIQKTEVRSYEMVKWWWEHKSLRGWWWWPWWHDDDAGWLFDAFTWSSVRQYTTWLWFPFTLVRLIHTANNQLEVLGTANARHRRRINTKVQASEATPKRISYFYSSLCEAVGEMPPSGLVDCLVVEYSCAVYGILLLYTILPLQLQLVLSPTNPDCVWPVCRPASGPGFWQLFYIKVWV